MNYRDHIRVRNIESLNAAVKELENLQNDLSNLDFNRLQDSSSSQWRGNTRNKFLDQFDTSRETFQRISNDVDTVLEQYSNKKRNLIWSIEDIPTKMRYEFGGY
ncbi:MAG: WXG100 family type VII secretion target [Lactobacillaceae bacterium]|jgi:hypothetical protein|nr:WXG100 family type VII secretion target [Lactobacillaceae bacterium]